MYFPLLATNDHEVNSDDCPGFMKCSKLSLSYRVSSQKQELDSLWKPQISKAMPATLCNGC